MAIQMYKLIWKQKFKTQRFCRGHYYSMNLPCVSPHFTASFEISLWANVIIFG